MPGVKRIRWLILPRAENNLDANAADYHFKKFS
jgi:hypothetical protein